MIRGLVWLLMQMPMATWGLLRFLFCFIGPWHRYLPVTHGCGCRVRQCSRCSLVSTSHVCKDHRIVIYPW